ncbi:hypothetical protein A6A08_22825 [Nocardiopsis sp. TSRI0078]|uniref:hypothetical protein n=1 Tax=unclassified Nocardiopsis TaxID=2649073 RepID=UPI000938E256|nr:hypothetical protein [Nocardiopsis sp. TSRI0078]OKI20399.1 hypothetical protein A6A08_22825 [Nocardiopsis sp. TSRI0078]
MVTRMEGSGPDRGPAVIAHVANVVPEDTTGAVSFLTAPGRRVNGQIPYANGGMAWPRTGA